MKLVFLDRKSIGDDIDLTPFYALGDVDEYSFTTPEEAPSRIKDADVIIVNKVPINEQTIGSAKHLKLVCVTATGTNNLDKAYLRKKDCLAQCSRIFYRIRCPAHIRYAVISVGTSSIL